MSSSQTTETKRGPVHEIRMGSIKATIWRSRAKFGTDFSVAIVRLYKNANTWVESSRFYNNDLLVVAKVADLAHSWIVNETQGRGANNA